jgi:phosphoenolpyruvate---glycerone phosphotransferase subunit DhaK
MKKLMNDAANILTESLAGLGAAHADILTVGGSGKFVRRKALKNGKVALISGGGAGHEPLHAGFVGHGMLDAACPGQVFTAPTPDQMIEAAEAVDTGGGVLFIVKNYDGDVMNFEMAAEMIGGKSTRVITNDDIAVKDSLYTTGRRGVAGTLVVEKIVGAAAEQGADLTALATLGGKVNGQTRSMGVALTSCTVPAAGKPTFEIGPDEMEFGVGIHGEPGRRREKLRSIDAIAEEICTGIVKDFADGGADATKLPGLLFVNGFGGTPLLELYAVYHAAEKVFAKHGVKIARSLVGNYVTSLDMAGCSITLTSLDDTSLKLWDAPVHTAALRWGV